jgi:hypothetical protein
MGKGSETLITLRYFLWIYIVGENTTCGFFTLADIISLAGLS